MAEELSQSLCVSPRLSTEFTLGRLRGGGGSGRVFEARSKYTNSVYALKVVAFSLPARAIFDPDRVREVVLRESRYMAGLKEHPNLVRYHSCWIDSARVVMVSEDDDDDEEDDGFEGDEVTGATFHDIVGAGQGCARLEVRVVNQMALYERTLGDFLKGREAVDVTESMSLLSQLAEALNALHSAGLVHRDIKPANIFVAGSDGGGIRLVLGDFGLAQDDATVVHDDEGVVGTPVYSSPEQLNGDPCSSLADIFSLGVIAIELFFAFGSTMERMEVLSRARGGVLPERWPEGVSEDFVEGVVRACLRADPWERPDAFSLVEEPVLMEAAARTKAKGVEDVQARIEALEMELQILKEMVGAGEDGGEEGDEDEEEED